MRIKKGITISEFLSIAITHLSKLYKNLEGAPVEGFMYVKGDFIIPPVCIFTYLISIQSETFLDMEYYTEKLRKNLDP